MPMSYVEALEMYAQHLNFLARVREEEWDPDEIADFEDQTALAKKTMESAWLEAFAR